MSLKTGLQPGTVMYTGLKSKYEPIEIEEFIYNKESIYNNVNIYKEKLKLNSNFEINNWINIIGIHDIELIKKIGETFCIDNLVLEDIVSNGQRPWLST